MAAWHLINAGADVHFCKQNALDVASGMLSEKLIEYLVHCGVIPTASRASARWRQRC